MARARWIVPWADSESKPAIYHCISRVVDRRFAFGSEDKEKFRMFMRMMENFSGCRVLAYCIMCNHIHLLLEIPPRPKDGISDELLLKRLRALYSKPFVAEVAKELAEARAIVSQGLAKNGEAYVQAIHERFTYRMHDLSEFMKTLLQRFTHWHNREHERTGNLWEEKFKSVVVEDGVASRTIAAYIDLNPVRSGMVKDPAEYRWSSYGEAMGAVGKSTGTKARAGLVRAIMADKKWEPDARHWPGKVSKSYRMLLLQEGQEKSGEIINPEGLTRKRTLKKGMDPALAKAELEQLEIARDLAISKILRYRIRYFTDGAVIGSREFVNHFFDAARERFSQKRKDGARKMRGMATGAANALWTIRDLRKDIQLPGDSTLKIDS
jgi:putative transposase